MKVAARISSGVKAVNVTVSAPGGAPVQAIVVREAVEARWEVGPKQEDLLAVVEAHSVEIGTAILQRAAATRSNLVVITTIDPPAS